MKHGVRVRTTGGDYIPNPEQIEQFHRDGHVILRDLKIEVEPAQLPQD